MDFKISNNNKISEFVYDFLLLYLLFKEISIYFEISSYENNKNNKTSIKYILYEII